MEIIKRNRTELKAYFVKNSIPKESNFAELIDGMLNQKEDGLVKLPGDPLSLEAAGDDTSVKPLINFYLSFRDPAPAWTLTLNPRSYPNNTGSARAGLNISDGDGKSRLFIDRTTGNVGIGTLTPGAKLDIAVAADDANTKPLLIGKGPSTYLTVLNNGNVGITATLTAGNMALSSNNEQRGGLFFAVAGDANHSLYNNHKDKDGEGGWDGMKWNTYRGLNIRVGTKPFTSALYVTLKGVGIGTTNPGAKLDIAVAADDATTPLLIGKGPSPYLTVLNNGHLGIGTPSPSEKLQISGGKIELDGNQQVKFTDTDTTNNLKLQLYSGYGLGINDGILFYAANGRHSWRDNNGTTERMALTTGTDGGLIVMGTGDSFFAGNVGIGPTGPAARLEVAVAADDGNTRLLYIGKGPSSYLTVLNNGNAGIGTAGPVARLEVAVADGDTQTLPLVVKKGPEEYLKIANDGSVTAAKTVKAASFQGSINASDITGTLNRSCLPAQERWKYAWQYRGQDLGITRWDGNNGWVVVAGLRDAPRYFKDSQGIVHLGGFVKHSTLEGPNVPIDPMGYFDRGDTLHQDCRLFTLPPECVPKVRNRYVVWTYNNTWGRVDVFVDGVVAVISGDWRGISLDGISFAVLNDLPW